MPLRMCLTARSVCTHLTPFSFVGSNILALGYGDAVVRLYGVLDIGLKGRDYLVGPGAGKLSVADLNVMPWSVNLSG
jgi:hypothetical protein